MTTALNSIVHTPEPGRRPCRATDLFLIARGLQCGNCLAHNVPPDPRPRCRDRASDGPCPLFADGDDGRCWIHRISPNPKEES